MKLMTDKPFGTSHRDFICMGIVSDSDKDYACLLQLSTKKLYIEEIHWGPGKNFETATLHQIDNDEEWAKMFEFVTKATTIFSPKKIRDILKTPETYFYSSKYRQSKDFEVRKKHGIL